MKNLKILKRALRFLGQNALAMPQKFALTEFSSAITNLQNLTENNKLCGAGKLSIQPKHIFWTNV